MKFAALISGGKDSCYNISLCENIGHELICTANLYPAAVNVEAEYDASNDPKTIQKSDDIESFMYQTAAHNVVPFISECLGVYSNIETSYIQFNDIHSFFFVTTNGLSRSASY